MRPHILVVAATSTTRINLRASLSAAGYFVTACDSCAAAKKALTAHSFSLAILDVGVIDGSGLHILREMRAAAHDDHMPVILLADDTDPKTKIRALAMGADAYVPKPYDTVNVIANVQELIAAHDSRTRDSNPPSSVVTHVGRQILIVDDSPTYRMKLAEVLRQDRHEVIIAGSGEEALALLDGDRIDAILLDVIMPGMDGFEVCRRVRRTAAGRNIPILLMTTRDDPSAKALGIDAGADELIVKSPELQMVKVRVRALIKSKKERMEQEEHDRPSFSAISANNLWRTQDDVPQGSLLYRVVMKSGLSSLIGPSTIARACQRAGVDSRTMTAAELMRALPSIRETLGMFLSREEAKLRSDAITELAREAYIARRPTYSLPPDLSRVREELGLPKAS